jgi:hypothetical protein
MTNVEFYAPAIGTANVPMGFAGQGAVDWNADGITVTAPMHSKNAASLFGCLGFIVCFVAAIALFMALKLDVGRLEGKIVIALVLGGTFGAVALGRKIFPPKVTTVTVSWASVKSLKLEGQHVTFVSKAKPKGQVWFVNAPGVFEQLQQAAALHGAKA